MDAKKPAAFAESWASSTSDAADDDLFFGGSLSPASFCHDCSWTSPAGGKEHPWCRAFVADCSTASADGDCRSRRAGGGGSGGGGVMRRVCRAARRSVKRGVLLCFGARSKTTTVRKETSSPTHEMRSDDSVRGLFLPCPDSTPPEIEAVYSRAMEKKKNLT